MRSVWMLAAAAALAACAGRGEDDMGAAPDRGEDTTITTGIDTMQIDTAQWDTTDATGAGRTPEPAPVPDTVTAPAPEYPTTPEPTVDTTGQTGYPADTTSLEPGYPADTTAVPGVDTSSGVPADPGMSTDTTLTPDTETAAPDTGWQGDTGTPEAVPPADSAVAP